MEQSHIEPVDLDVKLEHDDVVAGILKGGESDDEEMNDTRASIPTSPVSPVSPGSPNSGLKTEPLTPPQEKDNSDSLVKEDAGDDLSTPLSEKTRILKLSGDSGRKSRNRTIDEEGRSLE